MCSKSWSSDGQSKSEQSYDRCLSQSILSRPDGYVSKKGTRMQPRETDIFQEYSVRGCVILNVYVSIRRDLSFTPHSS